VSARKKGIQKSMINGAGIGMTLFVIFCSYCLGFWYGGKLVLDGEINVGTMLVVSIYTLVSLSSARGTGGSAALLFFLQPLTAIPATLTGFLSNLRCAPKAVSGEDGLPIGHNGHSKEIEWLNT
jgi:ABC transporter transmembrane region